jgi:DNA-binding GntR family transcriptional regulator
MPVPNQRDTVPRRLLRDNAYTALRDAIVDGMLLPGEHLHDAELCTWLGLSRTPVRDALGRLEEDGLVECRPQRYTRVTPLTRLQIREMFPLLAVTHGLATELAVPRLSQADMARLERENDAYVGALRARDGAAAHAADERFHAVFVAVAGNHEIGRVLERDVAQHQAIVARVRAGDALGAATAARENYKALGALFDGALADELATRSGAGTDIAHAAR